MEEIDIENNKDKDEDEDRIDSDDSESFVVDFTSDQFNEMSVFLKKIIVRQFSLNVLEQMVPFAIKDVKNTTYYGEATGSTQAMPQARISFRYYSFRFPELHGNLSK
jgi:hypothetical protein